MNIFATAKHLAEAHAKSGNNRQYSLTRMQTTALFHFRQPMLRLCRVLVPLRYTSKKDRFYDISTFCTFGRLCRFPLAGTLGKIRLRECERRHFFLFPIANVTAVPRTRPLKVHQQKRQVGNLSFLLVHLRGLEPRTH